MKGMKREEQIAGLLAALEQVILGKPLQLKIALVTLLARGHLLIEDLPGMGKTTLAHALAQVLGLACRRMLCRWMKKVWMFSPDSNIVHRHALPS